jgi:C-terminal processing protease CtpA/Prc
MKSSMKFLAAFLFVLIFGACSSGQNYEPEKVISRELLLNDFQILEQMLESSHPSLHRYISGDSLKNVAEVLKSGIGDGLTEDQFHILVRKYLKHIRCGHTYAKPSAGWYTFQENNTKMLPFRIRIDNHKMFVSALHPEVGDLAIDEEITGINGRSSDQILLEMQAIQQQDGFSESYVKFSIERNFGTYHLMLYGSSENYTIDVRKSAGETRQSMVSAGENVKGPVFEPIDTNAFRLKFQAEDALFYVSKMDSTIGFLSISSFASSGYKKFYKQVFEHINSTGIKHLVLDLRNNGGGYFLNGNRLLQYLSPEPFRFSFVRPKMPFYKNENASLNLMSKLTRMAFNLMPDLVKDENFRHHQLNYKPLKNGFSGELTVLTNGGTFSMSTTAIAHLKHRCGATIVGEETGGAAVGANGIIGSDLALPASGVRISVPLYFVNHEIGEDKNGRGVIPHYKNLESFPHLSGLGIQ